MGQERAEPVGQVALHEALYLALDEDLAVADDGAIVRGGAVPELTEVVAQAGLQGGLIAVSGRRHGRLGGGAGPRDLLVRNPLRAEDGIVLGHDQVHAIHGRRRHADHEGDVRIRGRQLSGVQATLAVAEQADASGVDLRPAPQVLERGAAVTRQVVDGGGCVIAAAAAHAPVVITQHGHAGRGQGIGEERERLERRHGAHGLIAVLRPTAGHEHDCRMRPRSGWHGQGAGQLDVRAAARKGHLFDCVAESGGVGCGLRRQDVEGIDGGHEDLLAQDGELVGVRLEQDQVRGPAILGEGQLRGDGQLAQCHVELVERPVEVLGLEGAGDLRHLVDGETAAGAQARAGRAWPAPTG